MDILVIEDEPLVREAIARDLREAGFNATEVANAETALMMAEEAAAASAPPSIIVTGLHLGPGVDGLALGAEMLRRWPETGVVYITRRPDMLEGRLLGPREHYLLKPVARETLLHTVRSLMPAWAPGLTTPLVALASAVATTLGLATARGRS